MSAAEIRKHLNLFEIADIRSNAATLVALKRDPLAIKSITDPSPFEIWYAFKRLLEYGNRDSKQIAMFCDWMVKNNVYVDPPKNEMRDAFKVVSQCLSHEQMRQFCNWMINQFLVPDDLEKEIRQKYGPFLDKKEPKTSMSESDQKLTRLIRHVYQQNPGKLARMLREAIGDFDQENAKEYDSETQAKMVSKDPFSILQISNPYQPNIYTALSKLKARGDQSGIDKILDYLENDVYKDRNFKKECYELIRKFRSF